MTSNLDMVFLSSPEAALYLSPFVFGLTSSGVTNCLLRGPTLPFSRAAVMKKEAAQVSRAAHSLSLLCSERPDGPLPIRVKTGKARYEHMFSALPLKADIALRTRYVRFVPTGDNARASSGQFSE